MAKFSAYLIEDIGASAAEYVLILAIVGAAIAAACLFLGTQIVNTVDGAGACTSSTRGAC